ncbi:MAG TPA: hypothetical protein VK563_18480 [Puia sp.]|nr:hypothetical protein [Puia sp.]
MRSLRSGIGKMIGKILSGETVIREFVTVGIVDSEHIREKVWLQTGDLTIDISGNQWLLGLDPRIVGVWVEKEEYKVALDKNTGSRMYFRDPAAESGKNSATAEGGKNSATAEGGKNIGRNALGVAELELFDKIEEEKGTLFLFKLVTCRISHIHPLKAFLLYLKFYKKPGVSFERLKAVAAAYTYPRRVRIISFKKDEDYNFIFPMDLLGDLRQSGRYLLGMRHSNLVLTKIMEVKKIVVSEVPAHYKLLIYKLGRNHSASPPPLDQLPFGVIPSKEFGFYLPEWVESYKEIRILRTIDLGSHMLLWGEWTSDNIVKPATPRLHHIHFLHFLYQKANGVGYPVIEIA